MTKHTFKVGDRVICPACDQVPGTVVEVGYNDYTKVRYDDGVVGTCLAGDLESVSEKKEASNATT